MNTGISRFEVPNIENSKIQKPENFCAQDDVMQAMDHLLPVRVLVELAAAAYPVLEVSLYF